MKLHPFHDFLNVQIKAFETKKINEKRVREK